MIVVRLHGQARWHVVRAEADGKTGVRCGRGWEAKFLERRELAAGEVANLICYRCFTARPGRLGPHP